MKVLILLLTIAYPVLFAFRNFWQWKELTEAENRQKDFQRTYGQDIASKNWHLYEFGLTFCFALMVLILTETWFHAIFGFFMALLIHWLLFGGIFGVLIGKDFGYLSDKGTDKFLKKIPPIVLVIIKLMLIAVCVSYYFVNPFVE